MDTPDHTLVCTKCGNEYPATTEYFRPDKQKRSGWSSWCRNCYRDYNHRYYDKNLEKERDRSREYQRANADERREYSRQYNFTHRDTVLETHRRWHEAHPEYKEHKRRYARARYRDNHDKLSAQNRAYYRRNPQTYRVAVIRRKSRERNLPTEFSRSDWQRALAYFDNRCAACGRTEDMWTRLAADHWIPVNSEKCPGTIPTNIVPLCHAMPGVPAGVPCCNQSKYTSDPTAWLVRRFGKREADAIAQRISTYFASLG